MEKKIYGHKLHRVRTGGKSVRRGIALGVNLFVRRCIRGRVRRITAHTNIIFGAIPLIRVAFFRSPRQSRV